MVSRHDERSGAITVGHVLDIKKAMAIIAMAFLRHPGLVAVNTPS